MSVSLVTREVWRLGLLFWGEAFTLRSTDDNSAFFFKLLFAFTPATTGALLR
jgi:hypothetical protein